MGSDEWKQFVFPALFGRVAALCVFIYRDRSVALFFTTLRNNEAKFVVALACTRYFVKQNTCLGSGV